MLQRRRRQDDGRHRGVEMAIADVGVYPIDHASDADTIDHHVKRMVVHVHDRLRSRAKARRANGHAIERLAKSGEGTVLDAVGDDLQESIKKRRFVSRHRVSLKRVRNLAESCACGIEFVKSCLRAHE